MFNYLAEVSILIIKFDNVFTNGQLQRLWPHYMKLIRLIKRNLDKLNSDDGYFKKLQDQEDFDLDNVQGLENILQKLEFLFTGDIFQVRYLDISYIKF